jgi:cellulose synthase/poly-beta-1,6-N-acetylglucosamine synthase-like glycosyltransferase
VKGFKAGALNEALRLTDPDAAYIAVIDSDYQVEPGWLRARCLISRRRRCRRWCRGRRIIATAHDNVFKSMCYEEYRGFFHIGMVERNEAQRDHPARHDDDRAQGRAWAVGGWSTWCITEDTELGLKLFEAGYSAAYIPESMGKGLTPDTLAPS